ncbi:hypothetical protein MKY34_11145 [Sporosarcina sp. FSL K6-1522]|uniref:hypothetical protein n=1 Tax=Sporosarcina sp. FSL K6-1522 TaxID=2921554 RepID=UPI00315A0A26
MRNRFRGLSDKKRAEMNVELAVGRGMNTTLTLTPADELKALTKANEMIFKEDVLSSKAYRRLLEMITENSLDGHYSLEFELYLDEDERILDVLVGMLKNAGYVVSRYGDIKISVKWA